MLCPRCGLTNPDGTVNCDCGYSFATGALNPPAPAPELFDPGRRLARVVMALLGVGILLSALSIAAGSSHLNRLKRNVAGQETPTEGAEGEVTEGLVAIGQFVVYVGTTIVFLMWVHRSYKNLAAFGVRTEYTPGWAVGYFFIPFVNLVRPHSVLTEIWKGSEPEPRSAGAPSGSGLVTAWWLLFLAYSFTARAASRMETPSDHAMKLAAAWFSLSSDFFSVLAAVLAILMIREISRRQAARSAGLPQALSSTNRR